MDAVAQGGIVPREEREDLLLSSRPELSLGGIEISWVPVEELLPADSPRLSGENETHAWLLAETEAALPPIVVHRETMRVIDGMHRLRAAVLRGQKTIAVKFFEGDEKDAFVFG